LMRVSAMTCSWVLGLIKKRGGGKTENQTDK
jgi:hypothetical protein